MIRRFPKFINIPRFIPISLLSFILMILSTYFLLLFWLSHRIWIGVSSHKKIIETFTVKCFALERFHQFLHRHQFLCLPYCIYINCKTQLAMSNILVKKQKFQFYNSFFFDNAFRIKTRIGLVHWELKIFCICKPVFCFTSNGKR